MAGGRPTSAVAQGVVSFFDAEGITEGAVIDPSTVKRKRKAAERSIFTQMTGPDSGLEAVTVDELAKLGNLFDWETHGQRMLATQSMPWLKREGPLPVLPDFKAESFALFMNRYCETMWMVHRLVPLIRPHTAPVPGLWSEKWTVLDESLQQTVFSLTEQLGKRVGQAFVEFVTKKFPFSAVSTLAPDAHDTAAPETG